MESLRFPVRRWLWCLLLVVSCAPRASLQAAPFEREADLKAAFLFNVASFANWPVDAVPAIGTLTFCVVGDWFVAQALEKATLGKTINSHALTVVRVKSDLELGGCHILYAGRVDKQRARELIDAIGGAAVLTVSDLDSFTEIGGTVEFVVDQNRMRFTVNLESARKARVQLRAQMLSLAQLVTSK